MTFCCHVLIALVDNMGTPMEGSIFLNDLKAVWTSGCDNVIIGNGLGA